MDDEVLRVVNAWTDAGPYPEYHFWMKAELRERWPVLGYALDNLVDCTDVWR